MKIVPNKKDKAVTFCDWKKLSGAAVDLRIFKNKNVMQIKYIIFMLYYRIIS